MIGDVFREEFGEVQAGDSGRAEEFVFLLLVVPVEANWGDSKRTGYYFDTTPPNWRNLKREEP
jgi:hypothetical protein